MNGWSVGKFFGGLFVSAGITILGTMAGVYWVVEVAISGMTSAIDATNERMGDVQQRVTRLEDRLISVSDRLTRIEVLIEQGFKDTQMEIRKKDSLEAPLDSPPMVATDFQKALFTELAKTATKGQTTAIVPNAMAIQEAFGMATEADAKHIAEKFADRWLVKDPVADLELLAKEGATLTTGAGAAVKTKWVDGGVVLLDSDGNEAKVTNTVPFENIQVIEVDKLLAPVKGQ